MDVLTESEEGGAHEVRVEEVPEGGREGGREGRREGGVRGKV